MCICQMEIEFFFAEDTLKFVIQTMQSLVTSNSELYPIMTSINMAFALPIYHSRSDLTTNKKESTTQFDPHIFNKDLTTVYLDKNNA